MRDGFAALSRLVRRVLSRNWSRIAPRMANRFSHLSMKMRKPKANPGKLIMTKLMFAVGLSAATFLWNPPLVLEYVGPQAQLAGRHLAMTLDVSRYLKPRW